MISIHASLAGGDALLGGVLRVVHAISIHASLAGGDVAGNRLGNLAVISIHASLAGGDSAS